MLNLSENAKWLLESRYLLRNAEGILTETPEQLFRRVAGAVALAELQYGSKQQFAFWKESFYELMKNGLFIPSSPTLMNAGLSKGQLSSCFVLPIPDSTDGIFDTLRLSGLIQKSGGGTGFNFSAIRPRNDFTTSSSGRASDPLSFIRLFDVETGNIRQGLNRRGANMAVLAIDHPDIEKFIASKTDPNALRNFNLSIGMVDAFMQAVSEGSEWDLRHPVTKKVVKTLPALHLWRQIIESAWATGEPGLLFLDAIERANPIPALGPMTATNPCGEVPLLPYESCNLGSLNLIGFSRLTDHGWEIDWEKLEMAVKTAIRFLDNVIDVNYYLTDTIKTAVLGNRKIGLGIMGWADLLIRLRIPYASEQAVQMGKTLMRFIRQKSCEATETLAGERGPFSNWTHSRFFPGPKLRNATTTSIAPTGSIGLIAGVSASIEPLFSLAYRRRIALGRSGKTMIEVNPYFREYINQHRLFTDSLMERVLTTGHLDGIEGLPEAARAIFQTALQIPYEYHLRHQAAFQEYTDNAVAKTVNMPNEATIDDVAAALRMAWQFGLKGITVYRNGSRVIQVLYEGVGDTEDDGSKRVCPACVTIA